MCAASVPGCWLGIRQRSVKHERPIHRCLPQHLRLIRNSNGKANGHCVPIRLFPCPPILGVADRGGIACTLQCQRHARDSIVRVGAKEAQFRWHGGAFERIIRRIRGELSSMGIDMVEGEMPLAKRVSSMP
jgi:hypothetical protein